MKCFFTFSCLIVFLTVFGAKAGAWNELHAFENLDDYEYDAHYPAYPHLHPCGILDNMNDVIKKSKHALTETLKFYYDNESTVYHTKDIFHLRVNWGSIEPQIQEDIQKAFYAAILPTVKQTSKELGLSPAFALSLASRETLFGTNIASRGCNFYSLKTLGKEWIARAYELDPAAYMLVKDPERERFLVPTEASLNLKMFFTNLQRPIYAQHFPNCENIVFKDTDGQLKANGETCEYLEKVQENLDQNRPVHKFSDEVMIDMMSKSNYAVQKSDYQRWLKRAEDYLNNGTLFIVTNK